MYYFMLTYNVIVNNKESFLRQAVVVTKKGSNNMLCLEGFKTIVKEGYLKAFPKAFLITVIVKKVEILSFDQYLEFIKKARLADN